MARGKDHISLHEFKKALNVKTVFIMFVRSVVFVQVEDCSEKVDIRECKLLSIYLKS